MWQDMETGAKVLGHTGSWCHIRAAHPWEPTGDGQHCEWGRDCGPPQLRE